MVSDALQEAHVTGAQVSSEESCRLDIWHPQWIVDVGHNCQVGIATDDGCFVVLYPNEVGQWRPATHIPVAVAQLLGQLRMAKSTKS